MIRYIGLQQFITINFYYTFSSINALSKHVCGPFHIFICASPCASFGRASHAKLTFDELSVCSEDVNIFQCPNSFFGGLSLANIAELSSELAGSVFMFQRTSTFFRGPLSTLAKLSTFIEPIYIFVHTCAGIFNVRVLSWIGNYPSTTT